MSLNALLTYDHIKDFKLFICIFKKMPQIFTTNSFSISTIKLEMSQKVAVPGETHKQILLLLDSTRSPSGFDTIIGSINVTFVNKNTTEALMTTVILGVNDNNNVFYIWSSEMWFIVNSNPICSVNTSFCQLFTQNDNVFCYDQSLTDTFTHHKR